MSSEEFHALYRAVFPLLFRVAVRITGSAEAAEDVCHEAFSRLVERDMVFPSRDDAKYWLIRVTKNAALNYAKRKARERRVYEKALHELPERNEDSGAELLRREARNEIARQVFELPEKLRAPLVLKEYADMNYREIAHALGISESNVKVRIFRAREKLAEVFRAREEGVS